MVKNLAKRERQVRQSELSLLLFSLRHDAAGQSASIAHDPQQHQEQVDEIQV